MSRASAKRTANHLEIHNVYGMENTRATHDGLLKLEPNRAALCDDARQLCGRAALRGDVDGRQLQHLEPSAA